MITIENANEFFVHKVKELLGAEEQVQIALMNWKEMVASERLRAMLARRLDGSDLQRERLHRQLERLGHAKQAADNATIYGITQDGARITGTLARGPLRDLAIMASASALGHYQVATYQFLHRMSEWHGLTDYREYLEATLQEVQEATSQLDQLAFDGVPIPVNPGSDETPEARGETLPETDPSRGETPKPRERGGQTATGKPPVYS